ncbi:MAG: carboxypeptidase-like regulatory domain-containing protein [Planctomycetota bacterium]
MPSELVPARAAPVAASAERTALAPEVVEEAEVAGTATLVGRVVLPEAVRAARMGDVRVWWTYERGVARTGSLVTRAPVTPKADGSFRLANLPVEVPLVLWANAPFALDWGRALEAFRAGEQRTFELVLEGTVAIGGRVVDTAGVPMEGVSVRVMPSEPPPAGERGGVASRDLSATSGEQGEFRLGRIARGLWKVVAKEKLVDGSEVLVDTRGGDVLGLELVLEPESCLLVRVKWPDGTPASGIQHDLGSSMVFLDEGELMFCGLPAGEHELLFAANRDGVHGIAIARVLLPDTRELELVLRQQQPISLRGTVRDERGNAVPGARVIAHVGELLSKEAPAGDGLFEVGELPEGRWSLQVLADGYWTPSRSLIVDALTPPKDFVLRPAATIRGRVVDAEGRAVAGARLFGGKPLTPNTLTDSEGRFSYAVNPGALELLASAKGHSASLPLALTLDEGEQLADVVLTLRPACTLLVRVTDTNGVPVLGAKVSIVGRIADFATDARGIATLEGIPLGHFKLRTEADGFRRNEQEFDLEPGPAQTLDLVLTRLDAGER